MNKKKIILYRSRFQPTVSTPHIEAITHLISILLSQEVDIQDCLFGFSLVKHNYEKIETTINELEEQGFSKEEWKKYLSRFSSDLNKTSIGKIKTDIAFSEIGIDKRTATFIIPSLIRTAIALYKPKPNEEDYNIINSLPPIKDNRYDIHWYFPIIDMDDINDMGYLSSIYFKIHNDIDSTIKNIDSKILFTRYNYYKNKHQSYEYRNKYFGRYIFVLDDDTKSKINKNYTNYYSSEIPNIDKIPFIYKWTSVFLISNKLVELLTFFERYDTTGKKNNKERKAATEKFTDKIDNIKESLTNNNRLFSGDLIDFFDMIKTINNSISRSKFFSEKNKEMFKKIYLLISSKRLQKCKHERLIEDSCEDFGCNREYIQQCNDFIEDHNIEKKRVDDIINIIDNYISTK